MSTCPHCNKELKIPNRAEMNVYHYGGSSLTVTECCGMAVTITSRRSYAVAAYEGNKDEDDWGVKIKKAVTRKNGRWVLLKQGEILQGKAFVEDQPGSCLKVNEEIAKLVAPGMEDGMSIQILEGPDNLF